MRKVYRRAPGNFLVSCLNQGFQDFWRSCLNCDLFDFVIAMIFPIMAIRQSYESRGFRFSLSLAGEGRGEDEIPLINNLTHSRETPSP